MDLLLTNGTVVTMNREREVLVGADVFIQDGRIARVGRGLKVRSAARRVIDVTGQVVMPGLIHGHIHACQTLFRNHADGLELLDWLRERIWPFEAAHDVDSMRASADLTFAELIQSGATAALDMGSVRHYDAVFESARDCGFRLTGGKAMMDAGQGMPAGLRETTEASISESLGLLERWHGTHGDRLRYAFAPRFVLSCTEPLLRQVARLAREKGVRIHTHASENATECDVVRQRVGQDNVAYFHALGLTGPDVTLAHCVWLTAEEQRLLRETGTVVCHCPSSNLKLASGIAKVPELMDAGVHVCLGADGAPCNNNLDLFMEMRLAALLHKPRVGPLGMPPLRVLEMATLEGARALGLESEVGSLEEGKRADVTVVDLRGLHVTPVAREVLGALVHAARSTDVSHVIIDGKPVLKEGKLLTLDAGEVAGNARQHATRIVEQVSA
ncbi:5'-deoxyadenosine deaminase [Stigmatella sp. ncwal1]|uniref:5'-deoxyadenosine deaminase n=1 Tax=Stigmatella ashevillensis TaxID=2995309 RepID=A0ABT5D7S5_9BACT|nr:5'-deoxyadenosine deaminase [Stigmatella ashevillena]MDC0709699.1 5'-deoxyadenosine deaminase [Stigmatella ashevillena]